MPLGRKVDGGSNYKCSDFEDRERILERITMNTTFEDAGCPQNENRKISMISLGPGITEKSTGAEYLVSKYRKLIDRSITKGPMS